MTIVKAALDILYLSNVSCQFFMPIYQMNQTFIVAYCAYFGAYSFIKIFVSIYLENQTFIAFTAQSPCVVAAGKSPGWCWLAWSLHTGLLLLCLRATAIVTRNVNLITLLRKWTQSVGL